MRPLSPLPGDVHVAVVIPARQDAPGLPAAVRSVLAQQPPPDEIVIVVGPSTDGTDEVAQRLAAEHDRVRVVTNDAGSTPAALNLGIAATTGEVVARVDAHAELPDGYLAAALEALRTTSAGNVGGIQVPEVGVGFAAAVAAAMRSPFGTGGAAYRSAHEPGPADTVYLGVFRREALEAVGGFDPAFLRNQDAELNIRLRAAGFEVWLEPRMRVVYRPRDSVRALASQYLQYGRWRRLTVRRHPGSLRLRQLVPPVVVVGLAGAVPAGVVLRSRWPALTAGGGYAFAVLAAAAHAGPDLRRAPATALALATMHLSWGVGFLLGPPRRTRRGSEHV